MRLDEIGYWSEIKLDIIKDYAPAYTNIMRAQADHRIKVYAYIDAYAGPGVHISKSSGQPVPGSPRNALDVDPPFTHHYFIDLDPQKAGALRQLVGDRHNVCVYEDDCNRVLLDKVFPQVRWEDYRRALCLLDPYGLHLNWEVIQTAGQMTSIEVFLNFPIMDINRNVLRRAPEKVTSDSD